MKRVLLTVGSIFAQYPEFQSMLIQNMFLEIGTKWNENPCFTEPLSSPSTLISTLISMVLPWLTKTPPSPSHCWTLDLSSVESRILVTSYLPVSSGKKGVLVEALRVFLRGTFTTTRSWHNQSQFGLLSRPRPPRTRKPEVQWVFLGNPDKGGRP